MRGHERGVQPGFDGKRGHDLDPAGGEGQKQRRGGQVHHPGREQGPQRRDGTGQKVVTLPASRAPGRAWRSNPRKRVPMSDPMQMKATITSSGGIDPGVRVLPCPMADTAMAAISRAAGTCRRLNTVPQRERQQKQGQQRGGRDLAGLWGQARAFDPPKHDQDRDEQCQQQDAHGLHKGNTRGTSASGLWRQSQNETQMARHGRKRGCAAAYRRKHVVQNRARHQNDGGQCDHQNGQAIQARSGRSSARPV